MSPVFVFAELDDGRVALHADAPVEAPTVRGFVAMLVEGLDDSTVEEILAVPNDLVERSGVAEILGMQRIGGLAAVVRRVKGIVARAAAAETAPS